MTTELTVLQRASVALGAAEHEKALVALAGKHTNIVAITNQAGYQDAQSARMEIRGVRVDLEKKAKAARDDANLFSKAVIAEEKRLIGLIEPEEERIHKLQIEWDERIAAEKKAKEEAELARISAIRGRIEFIRNIAPAAVGQSSSGIAKLIESTRATVIDDSYGEFQNEAGDAKTAALVRLGEMQIAAQAHEAEQARIAAERAELARLRAEQEKRDAEERARLEADRARIQQEQAAAAEKAQAELAARKAEQDRIEQEQARERQRLADEANRLASEKRNRELEASAIAQRTATVTVPLAPGISITMGSPASFDSPASVRAAILEELEGMSHQDLLLALDAIRFIKTGQKLAA